MSRTNILIAAYSFTDMMFSFSHSRLSTNTSTTIREEEEEDVCVSVYLRINFSKKKLIRCDLLQMNDMRNNH